MEIDCPLCQTKISVLKTKAGKSYTNCHNCHMRLFVNSQLGEDLLEQLSAGEVNPPDEPRVSPPKANPKVDGEIPQAHIIVQAIKRLSADVEMLKGEKSGSPNPSKVQKGKSGGMANWMKGTS